MSDFTLTVGGPAVRPVVTITRTGDVHIAHDASLYELRVALTRLAKTYWEAKLAPEPFGPTSDGE